MLRICLITKWSEILFKRKSFIYLTFILSQAKILAMFKILVTLYELEPSGNYTISNIFTLLIIFVIIQIIFRVHVRCETGISLMITCLSLLIIKIV